MLVPPISGSVTYSGRQLRGVGALQVRALQHLAGVAEAVDHVDAVGADALRSLDPHAVADHAVLVLQLHVVAVLQSRLGARSRALTHTSFSGIRSCRNGLVCVRLNVCTGARPVMSRKCPSGAAAGARVVRHRVEARLGELVGPELDLLRRRVERRARAPSSTVIGCFAPMITPSRLKSAQLKPDFSMR